MQIFPLTGTILSLVLSFLAVEAAWSGQETSGRDDEAIWRVNVPTGMPEPLEVTQIGLPDAGPRFERTGDEPAMALFERAVSAYGRDARLESRALFEQFVRQYPQHILTAAARAYLAESILVEPMEPSKRIAAIEAYRALIHEVAAGGNVRRAAWRIGDLYRELGWYQEAELAYQQALGRAEADSYDAHRSLTGLGLALLGMRKWNDAEKTFELVRKQATDPHLLAHASIGTAHALYRQARSEEAGVLYATAAQRWGPVFRRQPYALIRYAVTALHVKQTRMARRLLLEFYNLYPSRPEAPAALLQLADTYEAVEQPGEARVFYAVVAARYPETDGGVLARLRLIRLSAGRLDEPAAHELPRARIQSMLLGVSLDEAEPGRPADVLQEFADRYADSRIGSEALFRLGTLRERAGEIHQAIEVYGRVVARAGRYEGDPWPDRTGARLKTLLEPSLVAAVRSKDDLAAVSIFHRLGPIADRVYGRDSLLLAVADGHARLGFTTEAAALYQSIVRNPPSLSAMESALVGLGTCYLDQQDPHAAQLVFERYRLQFPLGRYASEVSVLLLTAMSAQRDYHAVLRLGRHWSSKRPPEELRKHIMAKMGMALMALHRPEEARPLLDEAYRLGGLTTAEELTTYGDLLTKAGLHEQAVTLYRRSLAVKPYAEMAAWDHIQIGRNFRAARRPGEAKAAWNAIHPDDHPLFQRIAVALEHDLPAASAESQRP